MPVARPGINACEDRDMRPESVETTPRSAPTERATAMLMRMRWAVRAWWAVLPLIAGPVLAQGLDTTSASVRTTAYAVALVLWVVGLVGVVFARTAGYTALRVLAPLLVVGGLVGAIAGIREGHFTMIAGGLACVILGGASLSALVLQAQLDAASYGSELRVPLKTPPVLFLGPLPLAWALVAIGVVGGPLLIASGRTAFGIATLVIGLPLAALAVRSVHTLSARWLVLVPAGVVVRDPMVLTDPILVPSDHIAALTCCKGAAGDDAIDLRLGAVADSVQIRCTEPTEGMRIKKGRTDTLAVDSDTFVVAPTRPKAFLVDYHARHRARS